MSRESNHHANHLRMAQAGYDFCPTCGSSLQGKLTAMEALLLDTLIDIAGADSATPLKSILGNFGGEQ